MKQEIHRLEKVLEVYAMARQREQAAYDFYVAAAESVSGDQEKSILMDLAKFELQHLRMMQDKYDKTLSQLQELRKKD
ncbi:MAG: hypothetical protein R3231_08555 [bacterium]|nr:hypothetical protein [bacterium]